MTALASVIRRALGFVKQASDEDSDSVLPFLGGIGGAGIGAAVGAENGESMGRVYGRDVFKAHQGAGTLDQLAEFQQQAQAASQSAVDAVQRRAGGAMGSWLDEINKFTKFEGTGAGHGYADRIAAKLGEFARPAAEGMARKAMLSPEGLKALEAAVSRSHGDKGILLGGLVGLIGGGAMGNGLGHVGNAALDSAFPRPAEKQASEYTPIDPDNATWAGVVPGGTLIQGAMHGGFGQAFNQTLRTGAESIGGRVLGGMVGSQTGGMLHGLLAQHPSASPHFGSPGEYLGLAKEFRHGKGEYGAAGSVIGSIIGALTGAAHGSRSSAQNFNADLMRSSGNV